MFREEATEIDDPADIEERESEMMPRLPTWVTGRTMVSRTEIGVCGRKAGFLLSLRSWVEKQVEMQQLK